MDHHPTGALARPRGRRLRPIAILAAALVIAAGSYGLDRLGLLQPGAATTSTARPLVTAAPAGTNPSTATTGPIQPPDASVGLTGAGSGTAGDMASLDKAVGVWAANLKRDPADFISAQNLALIYYTRGRLTGSADDYALAQGAVDQALTAYPGDTGAQTMRALLLYTLHDFEGARTAAQAIYQADPTQLQALATTGDSQFELGQYDAAAATFAELARLQPGAAVTARLARLASLNGRDDEAMSLAARAAKEATSEGIEGTPLAFYDYLQGFLAFQAGKLDAAATSYEAALKHWPGSYTALEGLAKVLAAQGKTEAAIEHYQHAIAIVPQPEFLAGLGDLYQLGGKPDQATKQYATVRAIAKLQALQAQLYNRQLVMFDANHEQNAPEALRLAENELKVRKDVYGWDAYAWALLANGRAEEADTAMQQARSLGTKDALLDYHAGMIADALGQTAKARTLLTQALARNPGFDPLQASRAKAVLARLPSTP